MQLSLFANTDGRIASFMALFATLDFGQPESWCGCQRCRLSKLVSLVRNDAITQAEFEPFFKQFIIDGYIPPGAGVDDAFGLLGRMGYEYALMEQP